MKQFLSSQIAVEKHLKQCDSYSLVHYDDKQVTFEFNYISPVKTTVTVVCPSSVFDKIPDALL